MSETTRAVFLSYASQDSEAAKRVCESLRQAGIEVWFDQSELRGGDSWDQKIRRQIRDCALFVPIISANTQARLEGYFRIEWKLAAQRTHAMAAARAFLVPVLIDRIAEFDAHVPDEFRDVQWTTLPNGDGGAAFAARVKLLLASYSPGFSTAAFSVPPGVGSRPPMPKRPRFSRTALAGSTLAALLVVTLAVWQPWRAPRLPFVAPSARPALTEARQLVVKAQALFEGSDDLNRENYHLAEEMLKQAEKLDVADAEAWAAHAQLSVEFYRYGFDRTAARIEAMRAQAERALRLDPNSINAQVALAEASDYLGVDQAATIAKLRVLSDAVPGNWRVLHALGRKLGRAGRVDEALTALSRADEIVGNNPSLWADAAAYLIASGRYAEAEIAADKSMARRSNLRALCYNAILDLCWHGDKATAMAGVEKWPANAFVEDRPCALAGLVWLWCRQPEKALAVYQRMPRDYLRDQFFTGPRAALTALAHTQAGHQQAARADWQVALQVAERELAAAPGDTFARYWKAWSLAQLGESAAATEILQQLEQNDQAPPSYFGAEARLAGLALALDRGDDALRYLERDVASPQAVFRNARLTFRLTRAVLELNPLFDPLRNDSRFQSLLSRAAAPRESAVAKPVVREVPTQSAPLKVGKTAEAPSGLETKSIAVLPFANRSVDQETEYFSDGISEELLTVLGKMPGLRVAGWTSALSLKGKNPSAQEVGAKLGVSHFVDGSVQKLGTRVKITARLTRTDENQLVWSNGYEDELKDIFALQDRIARDIAENLQLSLGAPARATKSVNPDAYGLVLEGRHYWGQRSEDELALAEDRFTRAIALDARFAAAHAGLADVCVIAGLYAENNGASSGQAFVTRGRAAALRARELDSTLSEPLAALAYAAAIEGNLAGADQYIRQSLALNPNHATAHQWKGIFLERQGRLTEAIAAFETAVTLDPLAFVHQWILGEALRFAGRDEQAFHALERSMAARQQKVFLPLLAELAVTQLKLGQTEKALATARAVRDSAQTKTRWWADGYAIWVMHRCGQAPEAVAYARDVRAKQPAESYQQGVVLAALGQFDEAIPYLARTPQIARRILFWGEMFDPYRDRRMDDLIKKLGCVDDYQRARQSVALARGAPKSAP